MLFYLAQPWWLLLGLLPLVWLGFNRWHINRLAQRYCSTRLMPFMRLNHDGWRNMPWRWLSVWALLVLALCQPKWIDTQAQAQQHPIQWVAVVDLSDSMQAQDVQPSRLQQARWLLETSLNHWQQGDSVGLIAFSASHHWLMPLTRDKALWQAQLPLLEARLLPLRGSLLQQTMAELDAQLPATVGILMITDGGGIDATQSAQPLSHPALMVVVGKSAAVLPVLIADGAGIDVGVAVSKVKRLAREWGIDWVTGEQASLDLANWLAAQRQHVADTLTQSSAQDRDLRSFFLLLALLVWLSFWRLRAFNPLSGNLSFPRKRESILRHSWISAFAGMTFAKVLIVILFAIFVVVFYQANAAEEKQDAVQASRHFQKAFRDALNEEEQLHALQGLASNLQAQSDWFSAAQTWRGVLAYQPENSEAKAHLKVALSHLPKSVDWSGEGGKRPKGSREGTIDDWPDMPEQEETKDVLREAMVKNNLEIPTSPSKEGSTAELMTMSQLAQQQKQVRSDTVFLGEARTLGAQQRRFYQRLFEQEVGFAAAQAEPQVVDGVAPW